MHVQSLLLIPHGRRFVKRAMSGGFLVLAALFAGAATPACAEIRVAPHRAAYTLELKGTARDSSITDAVGGMIYSWGETCDGWTVDQRFILTVTQGDGVVLKLTAISSTWESKDGKRFRFNIKRERNDTEIQKIRGEARIDPDAEGVATYESPEPKRIALPKGTVFPTMHTLRLMEAAVAGKRTNRQLVFDGSEVEPPAPVSAFILQQRPQENPSEALKAPLGPEPVRLYNLAFYPAGSVSPEPDFEMLIEMQDNGVAPNLVLDYGQYSVRGTLVKIEPLEKPDC